MEQRVNVHVILAKMNQNKVYSRHIRAMAAGQADIYIIKQVDRLKCYILLKFAPYEWTQVKPKIKFILDLL